MPTETAMRLIKERNRVLCEVCNIRPAQEAHHCLYIRKRGKRPVPQLDMDENLQLVCKKCHSVEAKTFENKVRFWHIQCERYGHEHMVEWHVGLPIKQKERSYK